MASAKSQAQQMQHAIMQIESMLFHCSHRLLHALLTCSAEKTWAQNAILTYTCIGINQVIPYPTVQKLAHVGSKKKTTPGD